MAQYTTSNTNDISNADPSVEFIYSNKQDDPIALITNHQTYYYLKDRLGLINNNQQLVEGYHYNAFGKLSIKDTDSIIINNSNHNNPYAYTGRRFDNESGLYYYRN
ncbi:hypothetical protein BGC33_04400, partial [Bathymodiolus thermophilus thioautotrophic gill symbiont]